jgi:prepilin-type N-terminal cleavage/methylation domain-containing protein
MYMKLNFFSTRIKTRENGFSLVELMIAIAIILILASAFVPLFVYIARGSEENRSRTVATALANEVLEEIRAMDFNDVGNLAGNPSGEIEPLKEVEIDGRKYQIETLVNWVEEGADYLNPHPPFASWDYLSVRVTVSAKGAYGNGESIVETVETLISRQFEQPALTGSNIRTCIFRGWDFEENPEPVPSVRIKADAGPDSPLGIIEVFTLGNGSSLIADIDEGTYLVTIDPASQGMIVQPGEAVKEVILAPNSTIQRTVFVDYPCQLTVRVEVPDGEITEGTILLYTPFGSDFHQSASISPGTNPVTFDNLWPLGVLSMVPGNYWLEIEGYDQGQGWVYFRDDTGNEWNGWFDYPGQALNIAARRQ